MPRGDADRMKRAMGATALLLALGCPADEGGAQETDTDPGTSATGSTTSDASSSGSDATTSGSSSGEPTTATPTTDTADTSGTTGTTAADESSSSTGEEDLGPLVDVSDPQLYEFEFNPSSADAEVSTHDATQLAELDTTATPIGLLVVYLHGAGTPTTCGSRDHGRVLAGYGFHVVQPCYVSDYGVGNCGDDIGGCRLEAFEGVDHSEVIDIAPPDAIETRVVRALEYLQDQHPGGDWQYFIEGDVPRWGRIIVSGISHGASTSAVIGMNRSVDRVVSLSGPLDSGQAWLLGDPITPIDRFWGFTHTDDDQHEGHVESFDDLALPGAPAVVDDMAAPYGGSHRLVTSAATGNGHSSTQAGGASPTEGEDWVFDPVWRTMYGVE